MSNIPEWLSKEDKNLLQLAKQNMLNDFSTTGWSVLHYAVYYHQNEIAKYLIKL